MYKVIIRPFLFLFSPEGIHNSITGLLKALSFIPFSKALLRVFFMSGNKQTSVSLWGLDFENPVGVAAGFDKNAEVYDMLGAMGFGFVEIGAVTPRAQKGNPKPRLFRLPEDEALINRMGFNNKGVENAVRKLKKRAPGTIIGANIGKNTGTPNEKAEEDYFRVFHALFPYVDYFTVNVSCPNITDLHELQDKEALLSLLKGIQRINHEKEYPKPVLLKISPDLNWKQIDDTLEIVKQTRIDGIVAVNTTLSRSGLSYTKQELEAIGRGGLSGKPLRERATEIIRYIHQKTGGQLPIIAAGGIMSPQDALEKLEAGATLIQVFTGFVYRGPSFAKKINRAIYESNIHER